MMVHLSDKPAFGPSHPYLLQWVLTQNQHLEMVGQGSQGPASEWVPSRAGGAREHRTPICLKDKLTQTTELVACVHLWMA